MLFKVFTLDGEFVQELEHPTNWDSPSGFVALKRGDIFICDGVSILKFSSDLKFLLSFQNYPKYKTFGMWAFADGDGKIDEMCVSKGFILSVKVNISRPVVVSVYTSSIVKGSW